MEDHHGLPGEFQAMLGYIVRPCHLKENVRAGPKAYTCDPSTPEVETEDHKFKITLSYRASSNQPGIHKTHTPQNKQMPCWFIILSTNYIFK